MTDIRQMMERMYLRHGELFAGLRKAPVVGRLAHYVSHRLLPGDYRTWRQVNGGEAKGLWIKVNPRTALQLCDGRAERGKQAVLAKYLRPGMVFYDAGANIGLYSLLAARLVGASGQVFSFEPEAENAARVRENSERNDFSWVTVVDAAVYSRSGKIAFRRASELESLDRGTGSVMESNSAARDVQVRAVSLDDFAKDHPEPDFVKLDVEGAEVEVLRGARKLLERKRFLLVCELHTTACEEGVAEILEEYGYGVTRIDDHEIFAQP